MFSGYSRRLRRGSARNGLGNRRSRIQWSASLTGSTALTPRSSLDNLSLGKNPALSTREMTGFSISKQY
jgi:hypothetical protein